MSYHPHATIFSRLVANSAEPINAQQCWLWSAYRDRWGYGRLNIYVPGLGRTVKVMAHVAAYVAVHWAPAGPDEFWLGYRELQASGLEIDHLCGLSPCIFVDHLEAVTPKENCRRRDGARNFFPAAI